MKVSKYNQFNIIEIVLAIAILAIGITGIMTLFPLGFQEVRYSVGLNYTSEAADSMFAYIARSALGGQWTNLFGDAVGSGADIPTDKPTVAADSTMTPADWTDNPEGDIYEPGADNDGIYGIIVRSRDIIDFSAEMLIWKSQITNVTINGNDYLDLGYDEAVGINIEMSWPADKRYDKRKKSSYYFELFNL